MGGIEMERKIGEIFEVESQWYQCVRFITCSGCGFANGGCIADKHLTGDCSGRLDGASVIFKKLEKIGKPYIKNVEDNITYQMYKLPMNVDELICQCYWVSLITSNIVEIAQTKEDMTESKLKPFNLEQAKASKPVCTRDGRKARIICFDYHDFSGDCMAVAVTYGKDNKESICYYEFNGKFKGNDLDYDLMMPSEKKSGWANIVKGSDGCPHMGRGIFQSKEAAEDAIKAFSSKLIDTIKIEWYE